MRFCTRCKENFTPKINYQYHQCPVCRAAAKKEYDDALKAADPVGYKENKFNHRLWSRYRLRRDQYDLMVAQQSNLCAGCFRPNTGAKGWHVDHDHSCCSGSRSCGKCVRALLCNGCNAALGHVNDDSTQLQQLIDYLGRYPSWTLD